MSTDRRPQPSYRLAAGLVLLSIGVAVGAFGWALDYSLGWDRRP